MPIYEYECDACGTRFDATQKFSDPALTACRLCNSPRLRKVLSTPAFVLKGSGWYATDYASGDRKKAQETEKASSAASTSPGEKPAAPATGCGSGACASGNCPAKG